MCVSQTLNGIVVEPPDLPVTPQKLGNGPVVVHGNNKTASEQLQRVRKWSINTYKVKEA